MTPAPPQQQPLMCVWTAGAPQPGRIAAWRASVPPGTPIVLATRDVAGIADAVACDGDPVSALRAVAIAYPQRDVVLAHLDAEAPADAWERLLATVAAHPGIAVLSALGGASGAFAVLPDAMPAARAAALCDGWGDHAVFATDLWSPGWSYWRASALRDPALLRADGVPEPQQGGLIGNLHVQAARVDGFPDVAPLPVRAMRERLAPHAAGGGWQPDGRPVVLHVLHGWGGGAERFVRDLVAADSARAHLVLVARGDPDTRVHGRVLALHHDLDAPPLQQWPLAQPIADTSLRSREHAAVLAQVIRERGVGAILVSSLIGHALDALRTGLPTAVCTHDYWPLWPVLHADFGAAAADWSDAALRDAVARPDPRSPFAPRDGAHWIALRRATVAALLAARATMVAPTAGVAANQQRLAPALAALEWRTIPHGFAGWPADVSRAGASSATQPPHAGDPRTLRVLVAGRVNGGKGADLLDALLPQLPERVDLVLLGAGSAAMRWFGHPRVHVQLDYARPDLPALVARLRPDVALLPASVSETFSHLLSELWSLDVPVLATRIGSYAERITDGVDGLLVAPDATAIAQRLAALRDDPSPLAALRAPALPGVADMASQWRDALPATRAAPAPAPAATPDQLRALAEACALAQARADVAARNTQLAEQQDELARRTDWAFGLDRELRQARQALEAAQQRARTDSAQAEQLRASLARKAARLAELEDRAARHEDTVVALERHAHDQHALYEADTTDLARQRDVAIAQRDQLQAEFDALVHSQSWRITEPLRWLRRGIGDVAARARYTLKRTDNAIARTGASLRTRGLQGTIQRAREELRGPPDAPVAKPDIPAAAPFAPFGVPCAARPAASIVVPVYNHFEHTLTCLRALAACGDATGFEVIVVDDCSSDETEARLRDVAGVRVLRNARNLGFIGACNAGAAIARGDFLVFLNNDTAVQPGWLDALVGTFDAHPGTGLAGAKLVYPDGRLQEAGGIVFRDASGWNYGRFDDPAAPQYNHVREADYCSGAAIAVPRALFERLGGFDTLYAPAYYEDTDLAMKVRADGLRVLYQPASVVVHFEGVTSGTDTGSGVKAYQVANREKFLARWRDALQAHPEPGTDIRRAREHRATRRVLVIDACTPMPDRDSGSLRMANLCALLIDEGCAVDFFADNLLHDGRYTEALQQLGVRVWWRPWIADVPGWFAEHGALFDTILASRHYVASNYLALARRHAPRARFVFDTVDLHYLREQREAELAGDPERERTARQTRDRELALVRDADLTLVVSPVEQALLAREAPGAAVEVLSNVHRARVERASFDTRRDIVFVGGYRHTPNVDAALWMARDIFPLIRARRDDIVLHLVGSDATPEVLALGALPGVTVHGHVPDLDPFMDGCRIGLAPLRYGAGVKGKVNLSMAHGQPVVATPAAVEGMHLVDGVDVLVGADEQAFADAVLRLYDDRALWGTLAHHGIANVERHFSFDAARPVLRRILG